MAKRVSEIASALGAKAFGDIDLLVDRPAEPASAGVGDLALAMSPKYEAALVKSKARVAVVWPDADWAALGLDAAIVVTRPRLAMAHLTQTFDDRSKRVGRSRNAEIHEEAILGDAVFVGAFSVIGAAVEIGSGSDLGSHVSVASGVRIGKNCVLHPGVKIGSNVTIGDNVILQPNVVVGGDGFSFVTETASNEERAFATLGREPLAPPSDATRHRIHSLGGVVIDDDVEIGANSTVDAGTIRATKIGRGAKIDNLVQVGHNVVVGEDCVLCAQSAVAGSSVIGERTVLGGKSGVKDNVSVGKDVVLAGAAIVLSDVPDGMFMMGYPAVRMPDYRAQQRGLRSLPALLKEMRKR